MRRAFAATLLVATLAAAAPAVAQDVAGQNAGGQGSGPVSPPAAEKPDTVDALALNPLASFDKGALEGFRDAPLFTPSRTRPAPPAPVVAEAPPPPPPPAEEEPPEPPTLKLAGIVEGPDGAVAFVSKEGEETVEQLRLGDQIDGWLVSAIDPQSFKLTLDEREQEYKMFVRPDHDEAATSGDDPDASSSDSDSSSDESDASSDDDPQADAQRSGAQREMEAARKAQQDARRRQLHPKAPSQDD